MVQDPSPTHVSGGKLRPRAHTSSASDLGAQSVPAGPRLGASVRSQVGVRQEGWVGWAWRWVGLPGALGGFLCPFVTTATAALVTGERLRAPASARPRERTVVLTAPSRNTAPLPHRLLGFHPRL